MKEEAETYKTWYVGRAATCKEVQEDIRKWSEWQRYLECERLPDPDSQKSLNTFLSQWEEWYHPVVIDYLLFHRKDKFNLEKGELYRKVIERRCKYNHLKLWGAFVMKRQRARALIIEFIKTFRAVDDSGCFHHVLIPHAERH